MKNIVYGYSIGSITLVGVDITQEYPLSHGNCFFP